MPTPATTAIVFGSYAFTAGSLLAYDPRLVLADPLVIQLNNALGLQNIATPASALPGFHFAGAIALALGLYYIKAGRDNNTDFLKGSIPGRLIFGSIVILMGITGRVPTSMHLFGLMDILGALWTWNAMGKEKVKTG